MGIEAMIAAYDKAHTRGAYRPRRDAYALALLRLRTGRPATYREINPEINGGVCRASAVRAGIADAHRDAGENGMALGVLPGWISQPGGLGAV